MTSKCNSKKLAVTQFCRGDTDLDFARSFVCYGRSNMSVHTEATSDRLTQREAQCLQALASGLSNSGIAKQLKISLPTVALHLCNARRKLGAQTREQAVALAVKRGLVSIDPLPDRDD